MSHKDLPITLITGSRICQLMLFPVSSGLSGVRRSQVSVRPYFSPIMEDDELIPLQQNRRGLIIGIVGTLSSGKSLLAAYLARVHGFVHLSLSTPLYSEARQRGRPTTVPELQELGNSRRHAGGGEVLVDRLRGSIQALQSSSDLVLTGIKNPQEVAALKNWPNFRLIAIDAPADRRYERYQDAERGGETSTSRDAFDALDRRDRGEGEPAWGQQVKACIEMANRSWSNDGAIRELYDKVDNYLNELRGELL